MPRSASGVYTLPAGNPVVPGTTIDSSWANSTMEDMANEITNSLSRTGAGGMLAPFRIADGTVTAPGLSYLNETNTGLYRSGAGSTWMSVLGVNTAQFSTVGVTIPSGKALTVQGATYLTSTLAVTGATTIASTLAVTGAITAIGGVNGNITGNVTSSGTSNFAEVVITGSLDMTAGSAATITGLSTPTNASDAANKGYVDSVLGSKLSLTGGTMTGAIAMSNTKITGLATPTADQDAATKSYVDSVAQGLDAKASCRASTTANITLSGAQTIDGVAIIAGDRVLVQNQSSAAQNGIYVAAAGAWARSSDANTWDSLVAAYTFIEQGTVNGNNGYICTIAPGGTLGTTPVTWAQFSGAGQITAGTGMSKTGNTLNVNTASSSRIVVGADDIDLATTGVTASTYKSVTVDAYGRVTGGTNPTTLAGYGISDAYTSSQVDTLVNAKLSLTGGTMSGVIAMGANKITGLADPTNPQDAATKTYIDTIFGSTTTAAASAAAAASSATSAATSATNAASSATAAAGSATSAAGSYTTFNNQYLGSKTSDPSTNNTGGALVAGNLYWNSTASEMRVYNGSAWVAAYIPAAGYLALTGGTMTGVINFAAGQTIAGYLTSATAAATYQTIAGMSSYLTSATAASTYQTISGMSSYLTTATAASTYAALASANTFTTNQVISANTSSDALKITQVGSGNALYIEDVAADATPFVVSSTGAVGIGTTTPDNVTSAGIALVSANGYYPQVVNRNKANDATASYLVFDKDRAGAAVQNGDALGAIVWRSFDGANYLQSSAIIGYSDGTPGTNDVPGSLSFFTTADGASSPTERLKIANTGAFGLSGANYGTTGQVLTSAGSGAAPTWSTPAAGGSKSWTSRTSSGSYTVPAGVTSIRVYAFGKGGDSGYTYGGSTGAGQTSGGGGGGCAFGDIAVTAGSTVSISISSGVATVTYGGTTMLTANPGQSGADYNTPAGGTASKNVAVTNGGAYSGGAGRPSMGSGGSSGSPLGNGYPGISGGGAGGAGWGGSGSSAGGGGGVGGDGSSDGGYAGGGGGGAGGSAYRSRGGISRGIDNMFTDPLLADCTSCGGSGASGYGTGYSQAYINVCGASASNGGGGAGVFNPNAGGFDGGHGGMGGGGGGAYGSTGVGACNAGNGGFGGGGGSSYGYSGRGGAGGYGGGAGCGYAAAFGYYGNVGGDAIVLIYA